jgi:hypothetical protein
MRIIWEETDIVAGLRVVNLESGIVALIGYGFAKFDDCGKMVGKWAVVELNTDGMSYFGATSKEVVDHMNKGWFPLSMFSGTGVRLVGSSGQYANMRHLSKWNEITVYKTDRI